MAAKYLKEQNGQAIFELIIFLPLFLFLIKTLFDYGDSINHSINQMKVVRGYYFYTVSNDSMLPNLAIMKELKDKGQLSLVSLDTISWSTESISGSNTQPYGSCVKVPGFLGNEIAEECNEPAPQDRKTQFIRVYTSFGVCTGSWLDADQNTNVDYSLSWPAAALGQCKRSSQ